VQIARNEMERESEASPTNGCHAWQTGPDGGRGGVIELQNQREGLKRNGITAGEKREELQGVTHCGQVERKIQTSVSRSPKAACRRYTTTHRVKRNDYSAAKRKGITAEVKGREPGHVSGPEGVPQVRPSFRGENVIFPRKLEEKKKHLRSRLQGKKKGGLTEPYGFAQHVDQTKRTRYLRQESESSAAASRLHRGKRLKANAKI